MKSLKFLSAFFLVISGFAFGQLNPIEIIKTKKDNVYTISLKNNTAQDLKLSLFVTGNGFEDIKTPITKNVEKFNTVVFTTIVPLSNKKEMSFKTSYKIYDESIEKKTN